MIIRARERGGLTSVPLRERETEKDMEEQERSVLWRRHVKGRDAVKYVLALHL